MNTKNFIGEYQVSDQAVDEIMFYWNKNKTSAVQGTISKVGKTLSSNNKYKKSLCMWRSSMCWCTWGKSIG